MSRTNARSWATRLLVALALSCAGALIALGCGGDDDDDAPPPPPVNSNGPGVQPVPGVQGQGTPQPQVAPGQVMVTVVANSTPHGAQVTGGGRVLGVTPLTTQVPIPAPQPGAPPQTFQFTFALGGFQPATINAAPVNNTITITAALAPEVAGMPPGTNPGLGVVPAGGGGGNVIRVPGRGGGPIFDNHTTTGSAQVSQACTIANLQVTLRGQHTFNRDLVITLSGPGGQRYTLQRSNRRNPFRTHTVRRAVGRPAQGAWNLAIADTLRQDSGALTGWGMEITCQ